MPDATPAPLTAEDISRAVIAGVAEANKTLTERLDALAAKFPTAAPPPAAPAPAAAAAGLTAEDVAKILDARDKARAGDSAKKAARDAYVAEKLKDVPEAYRAALGDDPGQFAAQEQAIRKTLRADLERFGGVKAPDTPGAAPAGAAAAQGVVDYSKMSAQQLITLGIRRSDAARGRRAAAAPTPPAGA